MTLAHMCYTLMASCAGGFDRVFPMYRLQTFSAYELNLLVCGEQTPNWTREDILNFTEPKYGYTKDRYTSTSHLSSNITTC